MLTVLLSFPPPQVSFLLPQFKPMIALADRARTAMLTLVLGAGLVACNENGVTKFNNDPAASIRSPTVDSIVDRGVKFTAQGTADDDDHDTLDLIAIWYLDGAPQCEGPPDEEGNTTCEMKIVGVEGEIILEVTDPGGANHSDSVVITTRMDKKPKVRISSPSSDGFYYRDQPIEFVGTVEDDEDAAEDLAVTLESSKDGVLDVTVLPDGVITGTLELSKGNHNLVLQVEDSAGQPGSDTVLIKVAGANAAPACEIVGPETGASFDPIEVILLEATATDEDVPSNMLQVLWMSNVDGLLGVTEPNTDGFSVLPVDGLTAATHLITIEVQDEIGARCNDSITLTIGEPPSLTLLQPEPDSIHITGEPVTFQAAVADGEDRPDLIGLVWTSSVDGVISTDGADSTGLATFALTDLTAGTHVLTVTAEDTAGLTNSELISFSVNSLPTAPEVLVTQDSDAACEGVAVTSASNLRACIVTESVDPDGDLVTYTYEWYVDGMLSSVSTTASVEYIHTTRGENWRVVVTPYDTLSPGVVAWDQQTILNSVPVIDELIVAPESPITTDNLSCSAVSATDLDGDPINYSYGWEVNGVSVGVVTSVLGSGFTARGDAVICTATPSDGLAIGATATSPPTTIGNSVPSIVSALITPDEARASDPLTCTYSGFDDPDGTEIVDMSTIRWEVNGVDSGVSGATLTGGYVVSDVVTCIVTPFDGTDTGIEVTDSIVILNSAPTITNVLIIPDPASASEALTCTWEGFVDVDMDVDLSEATWSINGVFAATGPTLSEGYLGGDNVACVVTPSDGMDSGPPLSTTITISNTAPTIESVTMVPAEVVVGTEVSCSWSGFYDIDGIVDASYVTWTADGTEIGSGLTLTTGFYGGETLACHVTPYDGLTAGVDVTASIEVTNTPPTIGGVSILPADPTTGDTVSCSWIDYADVDLDPDLSYVEWTLDGETISSESELLIDFETGEVLSCTVTPFDGNDNGSPVSTSVTIANRKPTIESVTISPEPAYAEDTLSCVWDGYSDEDGDPDLSTIAWSLGGTVVGTDSTLSGLFVGGDVVLCTVTPNDGKDVGVAVVSAIVISNSPPNLVSATVTPVDPYRSQDLSCSWTGFFDVDGDEDESTVQWLVDGSLVSTSVVLPGHSAPEGATVSCEVTADDGSDEGNTVSDAVVVQESIPSIASVEITPDPAYTNTPLTCGWSGYSDADADPDLSASRIEWHIGGVVVGTEITLSDVYEIDDVVSCTVTPFDGTHEGTPQAGSITIFNSPPSIETVTLSPDTVYEGDTFTCTPGVTTDIDGVTVFTYAYSWTVDGSPISASGGTLESSKFDRDESVQCHVSASDGTSYGAETASNTVVVSNSPPEVVSISFSPATLYTNDVLSASVVTDDPDGDTVTSGFAWFINGISVSATGSTLSGLAYFDRDDEVTVTVTPDDGSLLGTAVPSDPIVVVNTPPDAPGISITPPEPVAFVDDMLCQIGTESTDADGDSVTYTLGWTKDGGSYTDATTEFLAGDTVSADEIRAYESWTCTIVPNDGTDNGTPGVYNVSIDSIFAGWPSQDVNLTDADISFIGENLGDYLGRGVDFVGDLDGDGRDDIGIVAPENDDGGTGAGKAYVFLASSLGAFSSVPASSADFLFIGEGDDDNLGGDYTFSGRALAGAGDVDGDGTGDMIIGAPENSTVDSNTGRAYLFLGGSALVTSGEHSVADANYIFTAEAGDQAGHSVASAGDVDGDTKDDILIGAPSYAGSTGRTFLVSSLDLGPVADLDLPADADHVFYGEVAADWAGVRSSGIGDLNGDGRSEILIGAPNNDETASGAGRTYLIFSGSPTTKSFDLDDSDRFFNGESSNDLSGRQLGPAGDVDKDGYADFMIGSTGNDRGGSNAGAVFVFSGGSLSPFATIPIENADWILTGEATGDRAAMDVDSAGDVDGDGRGDIIIGAPNNDGGGSTTGRTYLVLGYFLPSGGVMTLDEAAYYFTGENTSDSSGSGIGGGGDVDNDGLDDLLINAPLNDDGGDEAGKAYLFVSPSIFD
jgi:hypothetical protein